MRLRPQAPPVLGGAWHVCALRVCSAAMSNKLLSAKMAKMLQQSGVFVVPVVVPRFSEDVCAFPLSVSFLLLFSIANTSVSILCGCAFSTSFGDKGKYREAFSF